MSVTIRYLLLAFLVLWVPFFFGSKMLKVSHPELYTPWLASVPSFYSVLAVASFPRIVLNPNVSVALLMAFKTLKLLLTLGLVLIFVVAFRQNADALVIATGGYFLVYLVMETWIMINHTNKRQS
jgi:hypothetical protein